MIAVKLLRSLREEENACAISRPDDISASESISQLSPRCPVDDNEDVLNITRSYQPRDGEKGRSKSGMSLLMLVRYRTLFSSAARASEYVIFEPVSVLCVETPAIGLAELASHGRDSWTRSLQHTVSLQLESNI